MMSCLWKVHYKRGNYCYRTYSCNIKDNFRIKTSYTVHPCDNVFDISGVCSVNLLSANTTLTSQITASNTKVNSSMLVSYLPEKAILYAQEETSISQTGKWEIMYMCLGYRFYLFFFLRLSDWILELFRQFGILFGFWFSFSLTRPWKCFPHGNKMQTLTYCHIFGVLSKKINIASGLWKYVYSTAKDN
jgi:hypothetical protein